MKLPMAIVKQVAMANSVSLLPVSLEKSTARLVIWKVGYVIQRMLVLYFFHFSNPRQNCFFLPRLSRLC